MITFVIVSKIVFMRKSLFLAFVFIGILCIGCQPHKLDLNPKIEEPGVTQVDRALLYGEWHISKAKFAEDATMTEWAQKYTCLTFKENGIYEGKGYYGDVEGIYTIQGSVITVLINSTNYVKYTVLAQAEDALTLKASFTSTPTPVWIECNKAEYLEPEPGGTVTENQYFQTDSSVRMMVSSIYEKATNFLNTLSDVELFIINGQRDKLQPSSQHVYNLWSVGYETVRNANTIISGLNKVNDSNIGFNKYQYIIHAKTLRDFVLYNMNIIWGGIPLVTEDTTIELASSLFRTDEVLVNDFLTNDLLNIGSFPERRWEPGKYCVNERVINTLMTECLLAKGDKSTAKLYAEKAVNGDEGEYFVLWKQNSNGAEGAIGLIVYSKPKAQLYLNEAKGQTESLEKEWDESFYHVYGYWAALKRLGVAKDKVGCEDYQLLLPIPQQEIIYNPNITQNPGY